MQIKCIKCGEIKDVSAFTATVSQGAIETFAAHAGRRECTVCRTKNILKNHVKTNKRYAEIGMSESLAPGERPLKDILVNYKKLREKDVELILMDKEEMKRERARLEKLKAIKEGQGIIDKVARIQNIKEICERRAHGTHTGI